MLPLYSTLRLGIGLASSVCFNFFFLGVLTSSSETMESSNGSEDAGDSPLSNHVSIRVHLSDRDPPPPQPSGSQTRENLREVEVSAHPSCCAQTETSHPPHPRNAGAVVDFAPSPRGATISHPDPLASGRGQIRSQLVPPANPIPLS